MRILGFDGVRAQDRGGFGFGERCFWMRMGISARGSIWAWMKKYLEK